MRPKSTGKFALVFVTAPDLKTARTLARAALKSRLVACANLIPKIESHYRWEGRIERSAEVLMLFKTTRSRLPKLREFVLDQHPYDVPEFVVVSVDGGSRSYLDWLEASVKVAA